MEKEIDFYDFRYLVKPWDYWMGSGKLSIWSFDRRFKKLNKAMIYTMSKMFQ